MGGGFREAAVLFFAVPTGSNRCRGQMAGNRRIERLNEQIRREVTDILRNEVRDPRIGTVTVTDVRTTPDLYHAKVYVTALASEQEMEAAIEGLHAAAPFVRTELSRRLRVRRVPELTFEWDRTLEQAQRIESLLREVRPPEGREEGDDGSAAS
jgi:ribosome-binding factor A